MENAFLIERNRTSINMKLTDNKAGMGQTIKGRSFPFHCLFQWFPKVSGKTRTIFSYN